MKTIDFSSTNNANFALPKTMEVVQMLDDGYIQDDTFGLDIQAANGSRTVILLTQEIARELSILLECLFDRQKEEKSHWPFD
jgi:hypothetical protein